MSLADRVKQARKRARMTQAELARATGQSRAAISLWENGSTKHLTADSAIQAADALNVSIKWLVYGSGRMTSASLSPQAASIARAYDVMGSAEQREVVGYIKYILSRSVTPAESSAVEALLSDL